MPPASRPTRKPRKNAPDALRALKKKTPAPGGKIANALAHPQTRWQRAMRYTWDKNRGRG